MCESVWVRVHVCVHMCIRVPAEDQKKALDLLELELQQYEPPDVAVRNQTWILWKSSEHF